jgi:glycine hydroxymethyltransferase
MMGKDFPNPFGLTTQRRYQNDVFTFRLSCFPGNQGGPLMHIIAAKAVAFGEALQDEFFTYAYNYKKMLKQWQKRSLKRYDIISGGTDNHMMLIDLKQKGFLEKKNALVTEITVNKIWFHLMTSHPSVLIRVGTPAITTRGLVEKIWTRLLT